MDSIIFNLLKKELEIYFVGFVKEDLDLNFFRGNAELQNLRLNIDLIQEVLRPIFPFVKVESAVVQKLRMKVPWTQFKTAPTELSINLVEVVVKEPVNFAEFQEYFNQKLSLKKKEKTGKYDYTNGDRILDGLNIKIGTLRIKLSLLGPFKHAKTGAWTPHVAEANLTDVEFYSTNEKWERVEIKETRAYTHGKPHVWHFKEAAFNMSLSLVSPLEPGSNPPGIDMNNVVILDKLPVKLRFTEQRLNMNEVIATETTVFIGEAKMRFTPIQLGQLFYWFHALNNAAFRKDVKQDDKPPVLEAGPNALFSIVTNKVTIDLPTKEEEGAPADIQIEINDFCVNSIQRTNKLGEQIGKYTFSTLFLRDVQNELNLFQLYFKNPENNKGKHLFIPTPPEVLIHPTRHPDPPVLRGTVQVTVRYPPPPPPQPAFEYDIKVDSLELTLDRDAMEKLAMIVLQSGILNANRPKPTPEDYKDNQMLDNQLSGEIIKTDDMDGVEFLEIDLLANSSALLSLSCNLEELRIKLPTPGGGELPYLELHFSGVILNGTPETAPAVYKKDFLELKSSKGIPLVMAHDFYYQKFRHQTGEIAPEYTLKFNVLMDSLGINVYPKEGAQGEHLCLIKSINSYLKLYSKSGQIPNRRTIAQVESSIVISEISFQLNQNQHHMLVDFLMEHFLYGASSFIKLWLEDEITKISKEDRPALKSEDNENRKRFLLLPTYMISAAVDKCKVQLIDDKNRAVVSLNLVSTEAILEKHDDRQIIIARLQDLRLHSLLPELENSIIWVKKNNTSNVVQFRTEWRKLYEGNPLMKKKLEEEKASASYFLGNTEGFRINLDLRNVYDISDYLVDILGETVVLIEKTQNSYFFSKVRYYAEILYGSGIPSETNDYWRQLREIKLWLEQFGSIFQESVYDISVKDFQIMISDESVQIVPFILENYSIIRSEEDDKISVRLTQKVKGSLWTRENGEVKEHVIAVPVETRAEYVKKKNPEWSTESGTDAPEHLESITFVTDPKVEVNITPENFTIMGKFFEKHISRVLKFITDLMDNADSRNTRKILNTSQDTQTLQPSVKNLKQELTQTKNELKEALQTQKDIAEKNAQLESSYSELNSKHKELTKTVRGYEKAIVEMQNKIQALQGKLNQLI